MRSTNIEIEFKTKINEDIYNKLLKTYDLENNVFEQTNYYFDTDDLLLNKDKVVLRIRQRGSRYKVTLKSQNELGAFENHVFLQPEQAKKMLENGFEVNDFFEDYDFFVTKKATLTNYRAKTYVTGGILFLDKCSYYDQVDYEIEFEVENYEEGYRAWQNLLDENNVEYVATKRKSERALYYKK